MSRPGLDDGSEPNGDPRPSIFSVHNSWRGVEVAGWTALLTGILSVVLFTLGASDPSRPTPTLLYPYFAAASVFTTTCVWILLAARLNVPEELIRSGDFELANRWAKGVLSVLFVGLCVGAGFAGQPGANAIRSINTFLFVESPLGMPFALASAFGNALALATLVYLGSLCNAIVQSADRGHLTEDTANAAMRMRELTRTLQRYVVMASALAVTSTLTLYLFFALADQIEALSRQPAAPSQSAVTLTCNPSPGPGPFSCDVSTASPKAETPRSKSAAYMALVSGLSFTGVLFVLFSSCSSAIDDRQLQLVRSAHAADPDTFSLKTFQERYGATEAGSSGSVMQALALVAPALTGLLTVITS